jgi:hypothetical protein
MDENIRSQLRLPAALHEQLKDEALRSGRSLNSEIVHRLAQSLIQPRPVSAPDDFVTSMADRLADPANREHLRSIVSLLVAPDDKAKK